MSTILVFIDGSNPTEKDFELGKKYGTKKFRNARAHSEGNIEKHDFAVAIDPSLIPEGCLN